MHRQLLHNGRICSTSDRLLMPGQVGFLNGWGVFSTIRIADGVLFAFGRHFRRMQADAERMRVPFTQSEPDLENALLSLVEANGASNATLRVAVVRNRGGLFEAPNQTGDADLIAFTADLNPWGAGVKLGYKANARYGASPFTGAKITSWAQNLTWNEEAHEHGFDEYILLNEEGQVSECTSANIFAVFGDDVWTPPLATSGCLPGVTRALLLDEVRVPGITVIEHEFTPSELETADQVFITSTTRDLLPVLEIDGERLNHHGQVMQELLDAFLRHRESYVAAHGGKRVVAA